ncbi:Hypothetical protein KVN_LOCUS52 [uncultured virus]|nr:Hypothetical protein KVN_LOCUS52 [uncultured virus]
MYKHLNKSSNIFISGCGGGYDIFCGLDLFFNLIKDEKKIIFGSYSFTNRKILELCAEKISDYCFKITKDTILMKKII